jgi:NADPH2:quinone reductase
MRAIVAEQPGGPEVLKLVERPVPEPGSVQALVRVAYADLNPLDTHARAKRVEWMAPSFPFTPGYEFAGRVERTGPDVDPALVGKRVASIGQWGGCADYAVVKAAPLTEIPDGFDWKLGTCFQTGTYSAWHLVHTIGNVKPGTTLLLHAAAGSVALMAVQIAKEAGATVYGTCSPHKMDFARPFGYDALIDAREGDWVAELKRLTNGRGVDLIIDGVAGPNAPRNYEAAAALGEIVYIGAIAGFPPPVDVSKQLYAKTIAVRGFVVYVAMAATQGREKPAIHEALRTGRWRVPITGVVGLADVPELHARFERRELMGKTLIEAGGEI